MTKNLSSTTIFNAISEVNKAGFSSIDISNMVLPTLGENLYNIMDKYDFHENRYSYYNEVSFYWPEDWNDVENGIGSFHKEAELKTILPFKKAKLFLDESLGQNLSSLVFEFTSKVKELIVENHHGLLNNELKLSRAMVRQMNQHSFTKHQGADFHEDCGYSNTNYQQLLSAIVTTHGKPTEALNYSPKLGELVILNAYHRRKLLNLSKDYAFIHKGPKSGPKLFFFFEFLGPR